MSEREFELQRQRNELQTRCQLLESMLHNLETEKSILERNVTDLQSELAECRKRLR